MMRGVSKRIGWIKFSTLSPDEVRKMSATKIITADTYDDDGFPIDMGLMDPHLGVIEPGLRCKTCGNKVDECPGHFGHIDLAMPVIHVGLVKRDQEAAPIDMSLLWPPPYDKGRGTGEDKTDGGRRGPRWRCDRLSLNGQGNGKRCRKEHNMSSLRGGSGKDNLKISRPHSVRTVTS